MDSKKVCVCLCVCVCVCVCVLVAQSCRLCDPMDCSLPGSSVHGILQARILEWVAMPSWTAARQAPLSMGFSRQEYWSGLPFPSPGNFPDPGIEHTSPTLQLDFLPLSLQGSPYFGYK